MMAATLKGAQMRALRALANSRAINGREAAGAINARGSTMAALVKKGLVERHWVVCDVYYYSITQAGRDALRDEKRA